jgi:hypothetical protein
MAAQELFTVSLEANTLECWADELNINNLLLVDTNGQHKPTDFPWSVASLEDRSANLMIENRFTDDRDTNGHVRRQHCLWVVRTVTDLSRRIFDLGGGEGYSERFAGVQFCYVRILG